MNCVVRVATPESKMAAQNRNPFLNPFTGLTRKHAIKCESLQGVKVESYVKSVAGSCGPDNVIAASRVNGSVIIFLSHVTWVDTLCAAGITINGTSINIEPLVKPATKIVISGVPPFIPDAIIEFEIAKFGKIVSKLRPISLGCKDDEFRHIKSFRRQIYVLVNSDAIIDGPLNFVYDNRPYRTYLSTDEMKCFYCLEKGHIRRFCPQLVEETQVSPDAAEDLRSTNRQQNNQNNESTSHNVPSAPQKENKNDSTRPEGDSTTPIQTTDSTDKPSNDNIDKTTINNEKTKETEQSNIDVDKYVKVTSKKKRKSKNNKEPVVDAANTPDNDNEPTDETHLKDDDNDDNNDNDNDEEMVLTHPPVPSPSDCSSIELLHLSGLPDTYNLNTNNISSEQEDIDNESVASDITDFSQTDTQTHQRDPTEIAEFLDEVLNSKMLISKCEDFCPNLHTLAKQLKTYNRSNPDLTKNQRARIHKYVVKIRGHLKTTGKKHTN